MNKVFHSVFSADELPLERPIMDALSVYLRRLSFIIQIVFLNIAFLAVVLVLVYIKNNTVWAQYLNDTGLGILTTGLVVLVAFALEKMVQRSALKKRYMKNLDKINTLQSEFAQTVGPTLDRMTQIMEKQDQVNKSLIEQVRYQEELLAELSKDADIAYLIGDKKNKNVD